MGLISKFKELNRASHIKRLEERAKSLYQICEYEGELWYTCNGMLVCPCNPAVQSADERKAISLLQNMRSWYVERHK